MVTAETKLHNTNFRRYGRKLKSNIEVKAI